MTDLFSKLTEAADLALDERERTEKIEREIEKLKAIVAQQRLASASALAFLNHMTLEIQSKAWRFEDF